MTGHVAQMPASFAAVSRSIRSAVNSFTPRHGAGVSHRARCSFPNSGPPFIGFIVSSGSNAFHRVIPDDACSSSSPALGASLTSTGVSGGHDP